MHILLRKPSFLAQFIQTNSFRLSFSLNIHERSIVIRGVQKRETNQIYSYLPPAKLKTVELTICGNKGKEKEDKGGKNSCQLTRSPLLHIPLLCRSFVQVFPFFLAPPGLSGCWTQVPAQLYHIVEEGGRIFGRLQPDQVVWLWIHAGRERE